MPLAFRPMDTAPWPAVAIDQYAPTLPSTSQLLTMRCPRMSAPVADTYWPLPVPYRPSCSETELETTPPQIVPVAGSRAPAYDSRLSLTLSRAATSRTGAFALPRRTPAVHVSVRNPFGDTP